MNKNHWKKYAIHIGWTIAAIISSFIFGIFGEGMIFFGFFAIEYTGGIESIVDLATGVGIFFFCVIPLIIIVYSIIKAIKEKHVGN